MAHRIIDIAQNGLMTLDPWLHAKLMEELMAVVA